MRTVDVKQTPRVKQLEGMFDIPPSKRSQFSMDVSIPIENEDWNVGLIVGPSGSGKTTIAREMFEEHICDGFDWPQDKSIVDAFPKSHSIRDITLLLSSVGFSSPPSWLRPFRCLSNGEQFRVTIARALAESRQITVIDEFTSVIDRTVAQIGSAAVAKTVRRMAKKFIALSCHYDVIDWLDPDWIYQTDTNSFKRRRERLGRPKITLKVCRTTSESWNLFRPFHYLDHNLNPSARCFVACVIDFQTEYLRPAAFTAVIPFPHPKAPGYREHRTVCLPDFQGVGIGNAMSGYIASLYAAKQKPYYSTTGSPSMIRHRMKSDDWLMIRKPSHASIHGGTQKLDRAGSNRRITASFRFAGSPRPQDARHFGLID